MIKKTGQWILKKMFPFKPLQGPQYEFEARHSLVWAQLCQRIQPDGSMRFHD